MKTSIAGLIIIIYTLLQINELHAQVSIVERGIDEASDTIKNGVPIVKSFPAGKLKGFKLTNKHGSINIAGWDKNEVEVETIINIETKNDKDAEEIIELLEIENFVKSRILNYRTKFSDEFFSNYHFTINYIVKVPKRLNITINNSIGDVKIDSIDGRVRLTHSYGNLELNNIGHSKNNSINLSFVEGAILNTGILSADISNCTMNITDGEKITGKTSYSMVTLYNLRNINLNTFTDRLNIVNTDSLTLKGAHFIGKITGLDKYGFIELDKGQLTLSTGINIESLTISNNNVNTTLIVPEEVSYFINGEVFNGSFTHPEAEKLQLFTEDGKITFSGKIGTEEEKASTFILFNKDSAITIKNK